MLTAPREPQGALPADTAAPKKAVLICLTGISGLICSLAAPSLHPHPTRRVSLKGCAGILGILRATSEHREGILSRYDAYHLPLFPCQKGRRQSQSTTPNRCLKSGHFHPPGQTCLYIHAAPTHRNGSCTDLAHSAQNGKAGKSQDSRRAVSVLLFTHNVSEVTDLSFLPRSVSNSSPGQQSPSPPPQGGLVHT